MNTTPRWSCRVARASISIFGDPVHRCGPGSSHVAHCAECRRFFAAAEDVTARLRADAARACQLPPANFDQRVLRALVPAAPAPSRRIRPRTVAVLMFAGAAAAIALVITVSRPKSVPADRAEPAIAAAGTAPAAPTALVVPAAPYDADLLASTETANGGVEALLEQNPLQSEAESVYADARGAVRFLALNFLPESTVAQLDRSRARRTDG